MKNIVKFVGFNRNIEFNVVLSIAKDIKKIKLMASISNNEIKKVKSLQQKKFRDEYGLFTVEGEKMVEEALHSRFKVENVYRRDEIGEEAMKRISALTSPSPVLAVLRKPSDVYVDDSSSFAESLT